MVKTAIILCGFVVILLVLLGCNKSNNTLSIGISGYFTLKDSIRLEKIFNTKYQKFEFNKRQPSVYLVEIKNNYDEPIIISVSIDTLMYIPSIIKDYNNDTLSSISLAENFGFQKYKILPDTSNIFILNMGYPEVSEEIIYEFEYSVLKKEYRKRVKCKFEKGLIISCKDIK